MATSSLYKTFYIDSKKEANAFVKMLVDSVKNPPKPRREVKVNENFSDEEWNSFVTATLSGKK